MTPFICSKPLSWYVEKNNKKEKIIEAPYQGCVLIDLFELIYYHKHMLDLTETTYDRLISYFQLISISSQRNLYKLYEKVDFILSFVI